ncbi:hypothetical protein TRV_07877 [Trichophyton verrucosum HKI 0517]|uniref:Uncharacterized protein n=1 Tax=Trichophyton verrucosum (strain HKI 0517) TaxID=663202 RepID=D4DL03_TRIVH|nr:uncharacterized protein TRV_07877 [Trichophyton verrucosum HKI 0517]EFE37475.1 hypothetical protein TRV_07877 [Trichophyton verrucosum HKI 0517]
MSLSLCRLPGLSLVAVLGRLPSALPGALGRAEVLCAPEGGAAGRGAGQWSLSHPLGGKTQPGPSREINSTSAASHVLGPGAQIWSSSQLEAETEPAAAAAAAEAEEEDARRLATKKKRRSRRGRRSNGRPQSQQEMLLLLLLRLRRRKKETAVDSQADPASSPFAPELQKAELATTNFTLTLTTLTITIAITITSVLNPSKKDLIPFSAPPSTSTNAHADQLVSVCPSLDRLPVPDLAQLTPLAAAATRSSELNTKTPVVCLSGLPRHG